MLRQVVVVNHLLFYDIERLSVYLELTRITQIRFRLNEGSSQLKLSLSLLEQKIFFNQMRSSDVYQRIKISQDSDKGIKSTDGHYKLAFLICIVCIYGWIVLWRIFYIQVMSWEFRVAVRTTSCELLFMSYELHFNTLKSRANSVEQQRHWLVFSVL